MLIRIFILGSILLASLGAATIDSGAIFAYPPPSYGTWSTNLASSGGGYSISVSIGGASVVSGPCQCAGPFPQGSVTGLHGFMITDAFRNAGSATVNGAFYPSLVFDSPTYPIGTSLELFAGLFTVDHAGSYSVPFSLTGRIQAALAETSTPQFLIDDAVTGAGTVTFAMSGDPGAGYSLSGPITYTFAAPEPNSLLLGIAGLLALVGGIGQRRHSHL